MKCRTIHFQCYSKLKYACGSMQTCCQMMLCTQVWYWTALSPSKAQQRNQADTTCISDCQSRHNTNYRYNKRCLHMTSTGEADRHHLLDAVLEKVFRAAGHLVTAGSACPHVLPSLKTWRHQPNTHLFVCHSQLH